MVISLANWRNNIQLNVHFEVDGILYFYYNHCGKPYAFTKGLIFYSVTAGGGPVIHENSNQSIGIITPFQDGRISILDLVTCIFTETREHILQTPCWNPSWKSIIIVKMPDTRITQSLYPTPTMIN